MGLRETMPRYSTVTELPVYKASGEQLARLYTRYRFAAGFCRGKDVFEAACGAGLGLGYLARTARMVVGGDIDEENLAHAVRMYGGRDNILTMSIDAQDIPFSDASFDVVIMHEAIYYLDRPEDFVREARRILRDEGVLIVCSANREWSGFNPSPYSRRYFSATELHSLMEGHGFGVELFGYCPAGDGTAAGALTGILKSVAVRLGLIPGTMKGKELLKRLFHGKLTPLPPEIKDGMAEYIPPVRIPCGRPHTSHKVIMAVAAKIPMQARTSENECNVQEQTG